MSIVTRTNMSIIVPRLVRSLVVIILVYGATALASGQDRLTGLSFDAQQPELQVGGKVVRLIGVHFPSEAGICNPEIQGCKRMGLTALNNWLDAPEQVVCSVQVVVNSGTHMARCSLRETDIGAWLVARGYALADRSTSRAYVREQQAARRAGAGLWGEQNFLALR